MKTHASFPATRMRRMRRSGFTRRLMQETRLSTADLIYPMFVTDGKTAREPVASMPGVDRVNLDELLKEAQQIQALGIPAIALFPVIADKLKSELAEEAYNPDGLVQRAVRALKQTVPDLGIITDVALDP